MNMPCSVPLQVLDGPQHYSDMQAPLATPRLATARSRAANTLTTCPARARQATLATAPIGERSPSTGILSTASLATVVIEQRCQRLLRTEALGWQLGEGARLDVSVRLVGGRIGPPNMGDKKRAC